MKIAIASGKGGTGKTTVSINLAYHLSENLNKLVYLLDCDVENPNDYLFLNFKNIEELSVKVKKPVWSIGTCIQCGKCSTICNYNAIAKVKNKIMIFNDLCHACGACTYLCPTNSLNAVETQIGKIRISKDSFYFADGTLDIGQTLAPTIIEKLKNLVPENNDQFTIIDSSPGTACTAQKAIEEVDKVILVTEPTPFGLNDLSLAINLVSKLKIQAGIIINRSYANDKIIEDYAKKVKVPILGKIPFDLKYAKAYSSGKILIKEFVELKKIFNKIFDNLNLCSIPIINSTQSFISKTTKPQIISNTNKNQKEIVVVSGKGGTGKTTVLSAFAKLINNAVLADTDVDASNLHILLNPKTFEEYDFIGSKKYEIDKIKCTNCGICKTNCSFNAISINSNQHTISELNCEGCGLCFEICPSKAISYKDSVSGKAYLSITENGYMSHARLGISEDNSGKLVSEVRKNARTLSYDYDKGKIIIDGPPGTGCPVIASVTGVDYAIVVTEPTMSGVHDMKRVIELCKHFGVKVMIIVNKYNLNNEITNEIINYSNENDIKLLGKIPFDKNVFDALLIKQDIITYSKGEAATCIKEIFNNFMNILKGETNENSN